MATIYDYRYYIDVIYLVILQRAYDAVYDPYLKLSDDYFVTPEHDDSAAIYIKYTPTLTAPTSEDSTLGLNPTLCLAVVEYVKHRLAKDNGDEAAADRYYNEFLRYLRRDRNTKFGGPRGVLPNYVGAIR